MKLLHSTTEEFSCNS